jgi:hypothetical protein
LKLYLRSGDILHTVARRPCYGRIETE